MGVRPVDVVWDVVIAGAGPAGLSAALVLGRACRKVLLCDTGTPRSWASKHMHSFITRWNPSRAQLSIVAAAEGTRAAFGINRALTREDFARKATGVQRTEHTFDGDAKRSGA